MRTTLSGVCLAGFLTAVLIDALPTQAAEQGDRDEKIIPIVYPIADLPVWMHKSDQFNPTLLIAYLKSEVNPASWERGSITKHKTTYSLVIRQTQANHQKIAEILTSLRGPVDPRVQIEVNEAPSDDRVAAPLAFEQSPPDENRPTVVVYPVPDLPVWETKNGEQTFDPGELIAYLKNGVGSEAWENAIITPHESSSGLVIKQTRANHRKIQLMLTNLRPKHPPNEKQSAP